MTTGLDNRNGSACDLTPKPGGMQRRRVERMRQAPKLPLGFCQGRRKGTPIDVFDRIKHAYNKAN